MQVFEEDEVISHVVESYWTIVFRRLKRNRMAILGAIMIFIVVFIAIFAPLLSFGNDPYTMLGPEDTPEGFFRPELLPPVKAHILGTDELARDAWSRLLFGARVSLIIGLSTSLLSIFLGTVVGLIAGYFGGLLDNVLMRFTDIMLSIPTLPLMVVLSAILKGGMINLILIITIFGWMTSSRLVRGVVLSLKEQEFAEAARAIGASPWRIMFRHLLPNSMAPIIVASTLMISGVIIYEATLSYLGLGIPQPTASWGNMLYNAQSYMFLAPQLVWWPGLAIFFSTLGFNFLGDGLRDALDPRLKL